MSKLLDRLSNVFKLSASLPLPQSQYSKQYGMGTGEYEYVDSPIDGYFVFASETIQNNQPRIRAEMHVGDTEVYASSTLRDTQGVGTIYFPCVKGGRIGFWCTDGIQYSYKFVTQKASQ